MSSTIHARAKIGRIVCSGDTSGARPLNHPHLLTRKGMKERNPAFSFCERTVCVELAGHIGLPWGRA